MVARMRAVHKSQKAASKGHHNHTTSEPGDIVVLFDLAREPSIGALISHSNRRTSGAKFFRPPQTQNGRNQVDSLAAGASVTGLSLASGNLL